MKLENRFKKAASTARKREETGKRKRPEIPEGLLKKCNACKSVIVAEDVKKGHYICPKCRHYFRMDAFGRLALIADEGSFEQWDTHLATKNPLDYKGYEEKIALLKESTGLDEAVLTGKASIGGVETAIGVCDSRFIMASMGEVVGEKITRLIERAQSERLPIVLFACSGGARMQEGIVSLMQMAKTSAALKRYSDAGGFYVSVLTNPTTGGVTASFAMLGDVILAEPGALIGFAGPRVIEQTIGQKLPKGFQKSEFLLEHGFIDRIVEREEMRDILYQILKMHPLDQGNVWDAENNEAKNEPEHELKYEPKNEQQIKRQQGRKGVERVTQSPCTDAWERVQRSRRKDRPVASEYMERLFANFIEFHGDRAFGDDPAIIGGVADFHGIPVTVIAQEKGMTTKENIARNFGMPSPEGYRKALRLMKQAEKFHRPILCFVDTPGAYCGIEAEERGQGEAIAKNLYEMSGLGVPILSIIIGEGGSGGALALAVADEVWMLENAVYSILSPEGFASILWKDSKRAKEAACIMKLTANDLKDLHIVEQIICEPEHFTVENFGEICRELEKQIAVFLDIQKKKQPEELAEERYQRFRRM